MGQYCSKNKNNNFSNNLDNSNIDNINVLNNCNLEFYINDCIICKQKIFKIGFNCLFCKKFFHKKCLNDKQKRNDFYLCPNCNRVNTTNIVELII